MKWMRYGFIGTLKGVVVFVLQEKLTIADCRIYVDAIDT